MFQGGWKKMSRKICGIAVDEKLYNEMMSRKFTVLDKTVNANVVEIYATSADIAENMPELAEAAKEVVEEIQNEIRTYYAAKDGRKEFAKMKHDDFGGYLSDLKEVFMNASKEREKLVQEKEKAYKKWEAASKSRDEYTRSKGLVDFRDAEKVYKEGINELYTRYKGAVNNIRTDFEAHLNDFYAPNGNRIDKATVDLLNSGIKLKAAEVDKLLVQFCDNPTMLRVLGDYSYKNGLNKESRAAAYNQTAKGYGAEEKRIFNGAAEFVNSTVGLDETRFWAWSENGRSKSVELFDTCIAEMDGYFVRPQVSGE